MQQPLFAGVDTSKHRLDVHLLPTHERFSVAQNESGWASLAEGLRQRGVAKVAIEATGALHYPAAWAMTAAGLPVAVLNPRQACAFRASLGRLCKTDALDAQLIALFAQRMQPSPRPLPSADEKALAELVARRRQLVEMLKAERNRLGQALGAALKDSLRRLIAALAAERVRVEGEIEARLAKDVAVQARRRLLMSLPGVGPTVALSLLTDLPELGRIGDRQIASLAGLAPHKVQSGTGKGRAHIQGGRPCVRTALSMASLTAVRHDPVFRAFYKRLVDEGKAKKLALIAVARKLVVTANKMVRNREPYRRPALDS